MGRLLCASLAMLAWGCNTERPNTCVPASHSIASSGTAPSNCDGLCVTVVTGDASSTDMCIVDCTDGGDSMCSSTTICAQSPDVPPTNGRSYCTLPCGGDAGCPSPLVCNVDAGACY